MSEDERKSGRVVSSSKSDGISLVREDSDLRVVPYPGIGSLNYEVITEEDDIGIGKHANCAYNSSISCASLSSSGGSALPHDDSRIIWTPRPKLDLKYTTTPPVDPEEPCVEGLILATSGGYYLITINEDVSGDGKIRYLGDADDHECVVDNVGRVTRFELMGAKSNCQPTRWAYNDGIRMHCIPKDYRLSCSTPMIKQVESENFQGGTTTDTVIFPHYGYQLDRKVSSSTSSKFTSATAWPSGCGFNGDTVFFSKYHLAFGIRSKDFDLWDTPGWDFWDYYGASHQKGLRLIRDIYSDQDCSLSPTFPTGNAQERLTAILNTERYCVAIIDAVEFSYSASSVANLYASNMAVLGYVNVIDPNTYDGTEERFDDAEIAYRELIEFVGRVEADPELPSDEALDKACDDFFASLYGNEATQIELLNKKYFRVGWGVAISGSFYYFSCILYADPNDAPDSLTTVRLQFPDPPNIRATDEDDISDTSFYQFTYHRGSGYRGFSTAPRIDLGISCKTRQIYEGYTYLGLSRIKDFLAYDMYHEVLPLDEDGNLEPYPSSAISTDDPEDHGSTLLTTGGWLRAAYTDEWRSFWVQRDRMSISALVSYQKDIRVRLNGIFHDAFPAKTNSPNDAAFFRDSPLLDEDINEQEPVVGEGVSGNSELYVGSTLVDEAHRYGQGATVNPWQNIIVGSTFHTNSGYTAITYTMPKLLRTTHRYWLDSSSEYTSEIYWWTKQEYWAAIISPSGYCIARWQLTGPPHTFDMENPYYEPFFETEEITISESEYEKQFGGLIEKGSVIVKCTIAGDSVQLVDDGKGKLTDNPNEDEGYETVVSSAEIHYTAGNVTVNFSTNPDIGTDLEWIAEVAEVDMFTPYETWGEIVRYDHDQLKSEGTQQPFQISFEGLQPLCPNLTITEDGHYAVFTSKSAGTKFSVDRTRSGYGDTIDDSEGSVQYSADLGVGTEQVLVFDLFNIVTDVPALVAGPLFVKEVLGDTLILN